jgi:Asp-tRNA(Asn)/Glu-tRNA(Gln) amidotransferase A subunit family amidase
MRFTIPVNMAGIPAITLPVGYDTAGGESPLD